MEWEQAELEAILGGERMSIDNRQQKIQMNIIVEGFSLEKTYRDDKDLVRVSQRYTESIFGTKSKK